MQRKMEGKGDCIRSQSATRGSVKEKVESGRKKERADMEGIGKEEGEKE